MGNNLFCSPQKKLLNLGLFQLFVLSSNKNVLLDGLWKCCGKYTLPFTAPVNAIEQLPTKSKLKTYIFDHIEDY